MIEHTDNSSAESAADSKLKTVTAEQKGSDADVDQAGDDYNNLPTPEEAEEQIKGSDADYDQGA